MLFDSFFIAGFECSTHRRRDGRRLDVIADTKHDALAERDYRAVLQLGLRTVRDGIRWHLIERSPNRYDWSSVLPMVRAGNRVGVQIIWDIFHYGWPDDIDLFTPEFIRRFAAFAAECARVVADETEGVPYFSPINEISFFSWAAGSSP